MAAPPPPPHTHTHIRFHSLPLVTSLYCWVGVKAVWAGVVKKGVWSYPLVWWWAGRAVWLETV